MKFSLIICTYKRAVPLLKLLKSVEGQALYPNEILIIDGSPDAETEMVLQKEDFVNLKYFRVLPEERGLTRQRNYGIGKVGTDIEIVCFLDDDIILEKKYFENLLQTYNIYPEALGVGGYIINESVFHFTGENYKPTKNEFYFDGWCRKDSSRYILRKKLGLDSDCPPGFSPQFSHGRSVGFLPPSGKIYPAEQIMGGVSSFRRSTLEKFKFSEYFEGYGLYEDADFTLRVSKQGKLYVNTAARLNHYHDASGRPNQYRYGKMVVRNGWYVWRIKNPSPSLNARFKWHAITVLLTVIRVGNIITTGKKKDAVAESAGRIVGWWSLMFNEPKITGYDN